MRSHDWSATPLGDPADWLAAVKTAVSICLNSRFPMVLWLGPELAMVYNDAWRPVAGATKHPQFLGHPGREVWPEIWDIIGRQLSGVVESGQATWSDDLLLLLDRFHYTEEAYFTYSYSPIHDEEGGVCGVFSAVSETTMRVIGERRLKTLSELGALIKAQTTEEATRLSAEVLRRNDGDVPFALIYLLDEDGEQFELAEAIRVEPGSAAARPRVGLAEEGGWRFGEVARKSSTVLVRCEESGFGTLPGGRWPAEPEIAVVVPLRAPGRDQLAGILVGGVSPYRRLDDDYLRFYELVAGHIATSIANARAYHEAQRRAEMLAELDRAKTTFFSNVSHEFRTPLTLLLGPAEEMLSVPESTPVSDVRDLLDVVHRNGLRLQRLVNTLLDFSRIEAGRVQASFTATDLPAFTSELASSFRSAMERAGLEYEVKTPALPEPVFVDREMWEKVVLNLISNGFKYTLVGSVTVAIEHRGDHAALVVSDTGVGIPEKELPRIFDRFHRVEGVTGRTHEGTGIGLALVQELVRSHGGSISVESAEGKGTTFTVEIPYGSAHLPEERINAARTAVSTALHAGTFVEEALRWLGSDEGARGAADDPPPAAHAVGRQRVLVADDNADMRDYVRRLLAPRYDVRVVSNGAEALEAALLELPDLVLSDVMMPVLDGFELLAALRANERTKTLPILLLSARAGEESRVEGLGAGADDYIVKPFSARELLARVDAHISLARMRRAADEARRMSELRLGLAPQAARMAAWEWDPVEARVLAPADLRRILGTAVQSLEEWLSLVHPDDRPAHREAVARLEREGGSYVREFRMQRADTGATIWAEERATAIADSVTGRVRRVVGVIADITERKAVEEEIRRRNQELERANNELEEFAYAASHDLQEPLRTVNIYTELLFRRLNLADDTQAHEFAGFVHQGVRRMEALIRDLLSYARVVHREQEAAVELCVAEAVEDAMNNLRGLIHESGASVTVETADARVIADCSQLSQVFQNLLSNSLKYRQQTTAPVVRIAAELQGSEWLISVADNGIGFLPIHAERIFGLFKRLHREDYPGTGLGLAISKRIVERYGGRMWASSAGDGEGATFYFTLRAA